MRVTAIAHTGALPNSPERFSAHALQQLVNQAVGTIVTANFDQSRPLGRVVDARLTDQGVELTMDLTLAGEGPLDVGPGYIAGALHINEAGERIVDDLRVYEFGVWDKP